MIKFEICEVDKIRWHRVKSDKDYNTSDVIIRDRRQPDDEPLNRETSLRDYVRCRIPSLQMPSSKYSGQPINPRRGNLVKVLFYKMRKGLVLNQISSKKEPPVCRPDPYTKRIKNCQYRPLIQDDKTKDFLADYPDPKKPQCENWQHGPAFGDKRDDEKEPCIGRDWWSVSDFCQEGDCDASCERCVDIDYPKRCKNSWHKKYSRNTMSCQAPNGRDEWKIYNGTYRRAEAETGQSVVYSEGKGHLTEGNASCDSDLRGHWTIQGEKVSGDAGIGSWEFNTNTEDVAIGQASEGVRCAALRPADMQCDWAYEIINFEKGTYIRLMKNGDIEMYSPGTIHMKADVSIVEEAPFIEQKTLLVHNYGDEQIDGFCTHSGCSCPDSQ